MVIGGTVPVAAHEQHRASPRTLLLGQGLVVVFHLFSVRFRDVFIFGKVKILFGELLLQALTQVYLELAKALNHATSQSFEFLFILEKL